MSGACTRRVRCARARPLVPLLLLVLCAVGRAAGADASLERLRLFMTPEARAALDGTASAIDGDASAASAAERAPSVAPRRAVSRRTSSGRPDGPPPGSATLRSSRGTSRIVDGVPERAGPS